MRQEEFKMERTGLVGKAYAMSANYPVGNRIRSGEGKVVDVKETEKGYFVTVEFDE